LVKFIGGLGFLSRFHCEKIKFLLFATIAGFLILTYGILTNEFAPTIALNDKPITFFAIFGVLVLAGYLGVIFYKVTQGKGLTIKNVILTIKNVILFWID